LLHGGEQIDDATIAYLRRAADAGTPLIGLCTGSFVLARAGLMTGRRCCVSWYHRHDFVREFPDQPFESDQIFIIDDNRITCSGGVGSADLAAALIERHVGEAPSRKAHVVLQLGSPRPASTTQPTPAFARQARDRRVRRAAVLMEQHLAAPLSVSELAMRVGVSPRQLDRIFKHEFATGPAAMCRAMRADYGRWLLLSTDLTMLEIASQTGFVDGGHFSRAFKRQFGLAPSIMRRMRPELQADAVAQWDLEPVSHRETA
jgi:transcriptional regulator GlxA family with amidase domain